MGRSQTRTVGQSQLHVMNHDIERFWCVQKDDVHLLFVLNSIDNSFSLDD